MDKQAIDALLGGAVAAGTVPGVVALAADRDGTIYQGAFGKRDAGGDAAMTLDTVMWLASMTKAITSVAALQLVQAGKLTLDDPIAEWLPELREPLVLEGQDATGAPILRAARAAITLKHLLTHTAGFCYDMWNAELARHMAATGIPRVSSCKNAALLRVPLMFDPGERWEYGTSIDYVGKAVERASGQKLGDYFHAHITGPLGMADTAFRITPAMRNRRAPIHVRGEGGTLVATGIEVEQQPEFEMGGGGLYGTLPDYLRFTRMLLAGGALEGVRILSAELTQAALRNQIAPLTVGVMRTAMPAYAADAEFFPGLKKSWGLVGMINDDAAPTGRSAGAIAWAGLANTFWWVDASRSLCGVIGTQLLPFGDPPVIELLERYETALLL